MDKKVEKVEKSIEEILEMLKKNPTNMKYVEEEIVIDVKFVDKNTGMRMIVDSGAPLSLVSSNWLKDYLLDTGVEENELFKYLST